MKWHRIGTSTSYMTQVSVLFHVGVWQKITIGVERCQDKTLGATMIQIFELQG